MSEAFHESHNGHHERVKGLFTKLSSLLEYWKVFFFSNYRVFYHFSLVVKPVRVLHNHGI